MASNITGVPNSDAPGASVIVVGPNDGDAGNAASVRTPFQKAVDFVSTLYQTMWTRKPVLATFTPQTIWKDTSGTRSRHNIDHRGYPMNRRDDFLELWRTPLLQSGAAADVLQVNNPRWRVNNAGASSSVQDTQTFTTQTLVIPSNAMRIAAGSTVGNTAALYGSRQRDFGAVIASTLSNMTVMEWEANFLDIGVNYEYIMGLAGAAVADPGAAAAAILGITIEKNITDTSLHLKTWDGVTAADVDTNFVPVAVTTYRFRLEIAFAADETIIRVMINGTQVATTATIPNITTKPYFACRHVAGVGGAAGVMEVSTVQIMHSRFDSIPSP